jgi:N-methylhydantoinase B/oxoprolinase/acetone carboxylase alpha subunit
MSGSLLNNGRPGGGRDFPGYCDAATVSLRPTAAGAARGILSGGGPAAPGRNLLLRDGTETELPDKVTLEARKHDIIPVQTPGGCTWGKQVSV